MKLNIYYFIFIIYLLFFKGQKNLLRTNFQQDCALLYIANLLSATSTLFFYKEPLKNFGALTSNKIVHFLTLQIYFPLLSYCTTFKKQKEIIAVVADKVDRYGRVIIRNHLY